MSEHKSKSRWIVALLVGSVVGIFLALAGYMVFEGWGYATAGMVLGLCCGDALSVWIANRD